VCLAWIGIHRELPTSVMGALKRAVNPKFKDLVIYICEVREGMPVKHLQNCFHLPIKRA